MICRFSEGFLEMELKERFIKLSKDVMNWSNGIQSREKLYVYLDGHLRTLMIPNESGEPIREKA